MGLEQFRRWGGDNYYRLLSDFRRARQSFRQSMDLRLARDRRIAEHLFSAINSDHPRLVQGAVLIEGMWDNPNHWFRVALLRAALGIKGDDEVGLVDLPNEKKSKKAFNRLGIKDVVCLRDFFGPLDKAQEQAKDLLSKTKTAEDIFDWDLPFGYPAWMIYDAILRKQGRGVVNIAHGRLEGYVTESIQALYAADALLKYRDFGLLLMSQSIGNYTFGALAWRAIHLGIPTAETWGAAGRLNIRRLRTSDDIVDYRAPSWENFQALSSDKAQAFAVVGRAYMEARRSGRTSDLASVRAFQNATNRIDRKAIVSHFGWDSEKPIQCVYTPAWCDYPHSLGMTIYRDYVDWLDITLSVARQANQFNWLFKAHPWEDLYGDLRLAHLLEIDGFSHLGIAPADWNGKAIQDSVDALITCRGSVGFEAACVGKPVLAADDFGQYNDWSFVVCPGTREGYQEALRGAWWQTHNLKEAAFCAQVFTGWYHGMPAWQGGFIMDDEMNQGKIYKGIPGLLANNKTFVEREISEIVRWFKSGDQHYHTFKMKNADSCESFS